ncbi:MAG: ArdC family protein [Sulfuricaulis sp.]|nr:ArdC family protein [Sulfuricaulis sp.]
MDSMNQKAIQQQALSNARNNASMANYAAIFEGFAAKGIPADQIEPRVNVFTFHAWKALGRSVRKGEHGVKVCTYVPMDKVVEENGERKVEAWRAPRMTTVFHISQTDT